MKCWRKWCFGLGCELGYSSKIFCGMGYPPIGPHKQELSQNLRSKLGVDGIVIFVANYLFNPMIKKLIIRGSEILVTSFIKSSNCAWKSTTLTPFEPAWKNPLQHLYKWTEQIGDGLRHGKSCYTKIG